jgi:hypothetical protein
MLLFATSSLDRVTPPLSHIAKQVNVRSLLVPTVELNTTATTFLRSTSLMMITRPAERDFMTIRVDVDKIVNDVKKRQQARFR